MRLRMLLSLFSLAAACGGESSGDSAFDAAPAAADAAAEDAPVGEPDASMETVSEMEPNNGGTVDEVNPIDLPISVTGAIDPKNDLDIFTAELTAGSLVRWKIESGPELAPHLVVAHGDAEAPTSAAMAAPATDTELEQFILDDHTYNVILRDARNVGEPENVGGPGHSYTLHATIEVVSPTAIAVGATDARTLASPFAVDIFELTLSSETDVSITVRADRLVSPSQVDSRLSLFQPSNSAWLITNDDLGVESLDSLAEGLLPAGTYWIVVDNLAPEATDLRYELQVTQN